MKLKPIFQGIERFTTKDYPNHIGITLFSYGCNFRCKYCYNSDLLNYDKNKLLDVENLKEFLIKRIGQVDSIIFCGGEPTLHKTNLINWMKFCKFLGYKIKLDTNGTDSKLLSYLIRNEIVDFVSIDFKQNWNKYNDIIQIDTNTSEIKKSIQILIDSNIEHDIRSTLHYKLHSNDDIKKMKEEMKKLKVKNYNFQFSLFNEKVIDQNLGENKKEYFKDVKFRS